MRAIILALFLSSCVPAYAGAPIPKSKPSLSLFHANLIGVNMDGYTVIGHFKSMYKCMKVMNTMSNWDVPILTFCVPTEDD